MPNVDADTRAGDRQAAIDRERRRLWLSSAAAAATVLVGAAAVIGSRAYPYWTTLGPGPGFFPRWLGGLLVVCGVAWIVQILRTARADRSAPVVEDEGVAPEEEAPEYSLPTVVAIVVSLCVLAATLETLGYQLAMFVFVLFHLLVLGRRRLLLSLALALGCSVGVFVAFTRFLTVPLPASSIPFLRDMGF